MLKASSRVFVLLQYAKTAVRLQRSRPLSAARARARVKACIIRPLEKWHIKKTKMRVPQRRWQLIELRKHLPALDARLVVALYAYMREQKAYLCCISPKSFLAENLLEYNETSSCLGVKYLRHCGPRTRVTRAWRARRVLSPDASQRGVPAAQGRRADIGAKGWRCIWRRVPALDEWRRKRLLLYAIYPLLQSFAYIASSCPMK